MSGVGLGGIYCILYTGSVLYTLGPGQILGIPGALVCGAMATVKKIQQVVQERKLSHCNNFEKKDIECKIVKLKEDTHAYVKKTGAFLAGMIPIVGGFLIVSYYFNPQAKA